MGSWIACRCGSAVHTNEFAGEKVYRLVLDADYDAVEEPVSRDALADLFFGKGVPVYCCGTCGRLIVAWDPEGGPAFYLPESLERSGDDE